MATKYRLISSQDYDDLELSDDINIANRIGALYMKLYDKYGTNYFSRRDAYWTWFGEKTYEAGWLGPKAFDPLLELGLIEEV